MSVLDLSRPIPAVLPDGGTPTHPSVVGRRLRQRFCLRNHDRLVVGMVGSKCARCHQAECAARREAKKGMDPVERAAAIDFRNPRCPRGHVKSEVGVLATGGCVQCNRERGVAYGRRKRRENPGFRGAPVEIENLRAVREELGLSLRQVGLYVGLDKAHVCRLESGHHKATPETRRKILEGLAPLIVEKREREREQAERRRKAGVAA